MGDCWPKQRRVSAVLHERVLDAVLRDAALRSRRAEAWIRSCSQFGAAQWLHSVPTLKCFRADALTYQVMLRRWLGMPLLGTSFPEMSACAGKGCQQIHDDSLVLGFHWDSGCSLVSHARLMRHNAFRDVWFEAYKEARCPAQWEP